jgi:hypothetical protein
MEDLDDMLVRVQRKGMRGVEARTYTVEMTLSGNRRVQERPEFTLDDYQQLDSSDPRAIVAHGLGLFSRLFAGSLAITFRQVWAATNARERRLRFRLALDPLAPALHAVPWELLHFDDSGGLTPPRPIAADARIIFSRYIDSAQFEEAQPIAHRPVRMLIALSAPRDLNQWNLAAFDRVVDEADLRDRFGPIEESGQFQVDVLPVASATALHNALATGRIDASADPSPPTRGYDVFLYYGHALHHPTAGSRLVLEHPDTHKVHLYDGAELIQRLQQLPRAFCPALVILVACNSATVSGEASLNSLAARLMIDCGVPAVLAMQRLVEITLARSFTFHLSERLLRDGLIDIAVNAERRRLFETASVSWTTPVLYMRNQSGRLFTPNAQLEYVESVLRNPAYVRWRGPEFIDLGVLTVAPGQDWRLLRHRPEDAPAATGVLEVFMRALAPEDDGRNERRREERGRFTTNLTALIGPPHSGQTTILQRLCYDLAIAVTRDIKRPPGLFISLAGYETQRGAGRLERHIVEQVRQTMPALGDVLSGLFRPPTSLERALQRPRFVFLLDDLDAVPEKARHDLVGELADLARRMPEQFFVITASLGAYPGQLLPTAQVLVIQPLTEQQIMHYLRGRDELRAPHIMRQIRDNRLLSLAGDPSLLALIYERVSADVSVRVTRNQLVQEYLDRALAGAAPRFALGDAARESLAALAWYGRWNHKEQLTLNEIFRILALVRRDRDYSLEELYALLIDARLLSGVGQGAARFVNPALYAYCAAVRLVGLSDARKRIADIITLCGSPERLSWWEDVIYCLAGLLRDPKPLFSYLSAAIRAGSAVHPLIAARCLEALPVEQEEALPPALRAELLDACVLRLRADREPIAERREQIVNALGRLSYAQVRHELRRLLVEKVRPTINGPRYEYTNVRIAAARALRHIYTPSAVQLRRDPLPLAPTPSVTPSANLVLSYGSDAALLVEDHTTETFGRPPAEEEVRTEQMLVRLMRTWNRGAEGREEFLAILRNSPSAPERALAAFAIGDMPDTASRKLLDARALLRVIVPVNADASRPDADVEDTMWAAADALTLFDPDQVAPLLAGVIERNDNLPDSAIQQLAYLAGRVRVATPVVQDWLIGLLINHPSQTIKSKALQSLAWMGRDVPQRRLTLPDGRPGPTVKDIVQDIAAGRPVRALLEGAYTVKLRAADTDNQPFYLRRKAIEALAWIGDRATLHDLGAQFVNWPIELREYWYSTVASIERRMAEV